MRWWKRLGGWLLSLLLLLATGAVGGYAWYRQASQPDTAGTLILPGLHDRVVVVRDRNAVPHIQAAHALDAYYALGYVHAQDRLWQMQMNKRVVAGRLAEILGADLERGCAWSFSAFEPGIDACAAPVMDATGDVIAAISVAGPQQRFEADGTLRERVEKEVKAAAKDLSALLGYRAGKR